MNENKNFQHLQKQLLLPFNQMKKVQIQKLVQWVPAYNPNVISLYTT